MPCIPGWICLSSSLVLVFVSHINMRAPLPRFGSPSVHSPLPLFTYIVSVSPYCVIYGRERTLACLSMLGFIRLALARSPLLHSATRGTNPPI